MQLQGFRGFRPLDSSTLVPLPWEAVDDWADSGDGGGAGFDCWDKREVALELETTGEVMASDTTVTAVDDTVEKFVAVEELLALTKF